MKPLAFLVLLTMGCSGDDGSEPAPTSCDRSDREGTFLLRYRERSGTCGAIPEQVVVLRADSPMGQDCQAEADWSRGDCRADVTAICRLSATATVQLAGYTEQKNENASVFGGIMTLTIDDFGDACTSTYDITYTRQ